MEYQVQLEADFWQGCAGPLLLTRWLPAVSAKPPRYLLILPPFGEELNCCRKHIAQLARQAALEGIEVLLPDFYGTGDSAGEHSEINWQIWQQDLQNLVLQQFAETPFDVLAWRLGAFHALQLLQDCAIRRLSVVAPLFDVQEFWHQQFRQYKLQSSSASSAIASIEKNGLIAIAGYEIPLSFYQATPQTLAWSDVSRLECIQWIECNMTGQPSNKRIAQFQELAANVPAQMHTLPLPPIWQLHEFQLSPLNSGNTLIQLILDFLA